METPNTFPDLFLAYSVFWAVLVIYLAVVHFKLKKLERICRGEQREES